MLSHLSGCPCEPPEGLAWSHHSGGTACLFPEALLAPLPACGPRSLSALLSLHSTLFFPLWIHSWLIEGSGEIADPGQGSLLPPSPTPWALLGGPKAHPKVVVVEGAGEVHDAWRGLSLPGWLQPRALLIQSLSLGCLCLD